MIRVRRVMVALLAAAAAVLATGEVSSGVEIQSATSTTQTGQPALVAPPPSQFPPSAAKTIRTSEGNGESGGDRPQISRDGKWQVFSSSADLDPAPPVTTTQQVFARNLRTGAVTQLSVGARATAPNRISLQPNISDNGRYVSFITRASNVAPNWPAGAVNGVVVCDRDPTGAFDGNGDPLLDRRNPATGSLTNVCVREYSGGTPQSVVETERPALSADGSRIAWVRNAGQGGITELRTRVVSNFSGLLAGPSDPNDASDPVPVAIPGQTFTIFDEFDPVLDRFGINVVFVALTNLALEEMVLKVSVGALTVRTTRIDVGLDPGDVTRLPRFGSLSISDFGGQVGFLRTSVQSGAGFRSPLAAAAPPPPPENRAYVATVSPSDGSVTAVVVSNDNQGNAVDAFDTAMSPDGRYVAFTTRAPNTHDGKDGGGGLELVARDLTLDAARLTARLARIPGALVTNHALSGCAPASPQISCAADDASIGSISIDADGTRVSFASDGGDLVTDDTNEGVDAFVRSWQPHLAFAPLDVTDFGKVQVGANKVLNVPVTVTGFGGVVIDGAKVGTPQFAVAGTTCPGRALHDGDTCSVAVRFQPTSLGVKHGTVVLTSAQYPTAQPVSSVVGTSTKAGFKTAAGDSTRVSVAPDGRQSTTGGDQSMISGDGRWDVFVSDTDLTGRKPSAASPDLSNVYVRDLANPQTTVQISLHSTLGANASQPSRPRATNGHPTGVNANGRSYKPSISSDGRFVTFFTEATDVVPRPALISPDPPSPPSAADYVLVVCDRDPTNAKDSAGNPILDRPRPGTRVPPDYVCYPVQSGAFATDSTGADDSSTPRLSGDGTRITWVEDIDLSARRVETATLSRPGGRLTAPGPSGYVPSDITGFAADTTRRNTDPEQFDPTLTEDGSAVVFVSGRRCGLFGGPCSQLAVIETTLATGTSFRFDTVDNDDFLGDSGGHLDAPATTDDGSGVAYAYRPNTSGAVSTVYVSTRNGQFVSTVNVSLQNDGSAGSGSRPALSGDGRYVAFVTAGTDMHNGIDAKGGSCFANGTTVPTFCQVVARDLVHDRQRSDANEQRLPNELVSTSIATTCSAAPSPGRACTADSNSDNPSIDTTGSEIGFDTDADDVVSGDTNHVPESEGSGFLPATDAFVHTWRPSLGVPAMNFGAVRPGASRTRTFTIAFDDFNNVPDNFGPISLGTSIIGGPSAGEFKILSTTCTGVTLHEGPPAGRPAGAAPERCTFTIRFRPTVPGRRDATLQTKVGRNGYPRQSPDGTISYDPAIVNALTGFGATPVVSVNPNPVNFGTRLPHDPLTKTVTVTNSGSSGLVITNVAVTDSSHPGAKNDYAVDFTDCTGTVAAGGSCVIRVTFTGLKVGIRDSVLVITSNVDGGVTSVGLRARVNPPTVESNPAVSPVRRVITISGTGFAPTHDVEVGFDGNPQVTVTARADGTFTLQMVVLPNGPQGPRMLFGHSVGFDKSIASDFPFLVVLSSTDPGLVVVRD